MKVLITGGNGFLGRNLAARLNSHGNKLVIAYNNNSQFIPSSIQSVKVNEISRLKFEPEVIFHLGAYIPCGDSPDKRKLEELNVAITEMLCKTYAYAKWVYSSTVSVYKPQEQKISENTPPDPQNLYGLSKLRAEQVVSKLERYAIIRFSSIYGPGMSKETIIPKLIKAAKERQNITLFGDGSRLQDYLFIDDAVNMLISSMNASNGIYLGATGKSYSNLELANYIAQQYPAKVTLVPGSQGPSYNYDNSYTRMALGYAPETSLIHGIMALAGSK